MSDLEGLHLEGLDLEGGEWPFLWETFKHDRVSGQDLYDYSMYVSLCVGRGGYQLQIYQPDRFIQCYTNGQ